MGFVFWIHGEGQPLPDGEVLVVANREVRAAMGSKRAAKKGEEGDGSLCCSAARSQMGGTTGGTCQLPVFAPSLLHGVSGSPLWVISPIFKSPG